MMHTEELLKAIAVHRGDAIVVPGRGGRHWVNISEKPDLDIPLGDPAMGGHAGFAFGLALAVPQRRVILIDSEGDVQMGLGVLLSVAEQKPANFYHFMLDNEVYATTGGQPVANAKNVSYETIARGAGYPRTYAITELDDLVKKLPEIFGAPGPVFVAMKIHADIQNKPIGQRVKWMKKTREQAINDMRKAVGITV